MRGERYNLELAWVRCPPVTITIEMSLNDMPVEATAVRILDKSTWTIPRVDPIWQLEPDEVRWTCPVTQLPCIIYRLFTTGCWGGGVGITECHPVFASELKSDFRVHGGVVGMMPFNDDTFYLPIPPELHWIVWDAGHAYDLRPQETDIMTRVLQLQDAFLTLEQDIDRVTYKTAEFAIEQTCALALQIGFFEVIDE